MLNRMVKPILADAQMSVDASRRIAESLSTQHGKWIGKYLHAVDSINPLFITAHGSLLALRLHAVPSRPIAFLRSTDAKLILRLRWVDIVVSGPSDLLERVERRRHFQVRCSLTTEERMAGAVRLTIQAMDNVNRWAAMTRA